MGEKILYENDDLKIINKIKEIIISRHPIEDDRFYTVTTLPSPHMNININFLPSYDKKSTYITFSDGNSDFEITNEDELLIDGLISQNTVKELIKFIYSDHGKISCFDKLGDAIKIIFCVNLSEKPKGISCDDIRLILNFSFVKLSDYDKMVDSYFDMIIREFKNQLKNTSWYEKEYEKYVEQIRNYIIDNFDLQKFRLFVKSISNEYLNRILLTQLPNEFLDEIIFESKNNEKIKNLTK